MRLGPTMASWSTPRAIASLPSEMREAQLKKEQREAPLRARLKVETMPAVAEWVNGG